MGDRAYRTGSRWSRGGARGAALRLLAVRPRSVHELEERLRARGCAAAEITAVIGGLEASGLLDDLQFARTLVESELRRKPVGRLWIRRKLRRHAVPDSIAEVALAELFPRERERALAREAAQRKLSGQSHDHQGPLGRQSARLARFLLSRGFAPEIVAEMQEPLSLRMTDVA